MKNQFTSPVHWNGEPTLTVAEAARIAARSKTWIRNRLIDGSLRGGRAPSGSRIVSASSLTALLAQPPRPAEPDRFAAVPKLRRGNHLRLVVDNGRPR